MELESLPPMQIRELLKSIENRRLPSEQKSDQKLHCENSFAQVSIVLRNSETSIEMSTLITFALFAGKNDQKECDYRLEERIEQPLECSSFEMGTVQRRKKRNIYMFGADKEKNGLGEEVKEGIYRKQHAKVLTMK